MKNYLILIYCFMLSGCSQPFFKSVQGTSTSIGLSIPSEDALQMEAVHYLNGEKVIIRDSSTIEYVFKTAETNSYFGIIHTQSQRDSSLKIENPTIKDQQNEQ